MDKGVKIIGVTVVLLLIASVIAIFLNLRKSDNTYVVILQDNEVIYSFNLSDEKDRTFRIECPNGGWNDVKIEDGKICTEFTWKNIESSTVTQKMVQNES